MNENEKIEHATLNKRVGRYAAPIGLTLALLSGAAEIASGPGSRIGLWHYGTGIKMLGIAGIAGGLGAVISLLAGIFSDSRTAASRMAVAGIILGLIAAGIPWSLSRTAKQLPRIHDITTDTDMPPDFRAVLALRQGALNPVEYGGRSVAEQQNRAYPDIQPLVLPAAPQAALERALSVATDMGWNVVSVDPAQGRIEATATTFWFGFKDDVVVRIAPAKEGSRVDVRSLSRVGVSDVGTNAKRVRTFLERMKAAM